MNSLKLKPTQKPPGNVFTGSKGINLDSKGEKYLWSMGGALIIGLIMIAAFLLLILVNGLKTFYPGPVHRVTLTDNRVIAGEPFRREKISQDHTLETSREDTCSAWRTLYKTGNFDLYNKDFRWVDEQDIKQISEPKDIFYIERTEWGPFIGYIHELNLNHETFFFSRERLSQLKKEHKAAQARRNILKDLKKREMGSINHELDNLRLSLKRVELDHGKDSVRYKTTLDSLSAKRKKLEENYGEIADKIEIIIKKDAKYSVVLKDVSGIEKRVNISDIIRFYPANNLTLSQKAGIYISRWIEFLTAEPREANIEGGVMPAIFGTFAMTLLMVIIVAPLGVMASLYLKEYAKQGKLVSMVRICVNNLAGVPSIVYGAFGLGFFAYCVGTTVDRIFFPEYLPNPVYGTGGILWAALTLALLTLPVVIVATEEALAAVPQSLREGSLACGASKWQTIKNIVLPNALPGIMTGLILAMARGAGEVAPLMLVGVVKLAPDLPVDTIFPFIHPERSFMHLGFHIFDVGFQSRNAEAGKPMVFVTTLLLISLIGLMNAFAIHIRSRMKKKYSAGQ